MLVSCRQPELIATTKTGVPMHQPREEVMNERPSPYSALKARRPRIRAFRHGHSGDRDRRARLAIELAMSRVFGIGADDLWHDSRGEKRIATARQIAMYLAHVSCGLSLTDVGRLFGRDRTTVAHGCLRIEIKRDDPLLDRTLDLLGWAVPSIAEREPESFARH